MNSDLKFSRIIAGAMTWGQGGRRLSTPEMTGLIGHCMELGIHTFDHADIYGGYTTEEAFGKAFAQSGIARDAVQMISKCGIQYPSAARPLQVKHYQYDRAYILWSAEQSLQKLGTEYLDLLLLHRPSPLMDPTEVAAAFEALSRSGKVRAFGVSNFTPSQIALIASAAPVEAHQFECSLTAREALFDGVLDDCLQHGRLAMAWSPLGSYFREASEAKARIDVVFETLKSKYEASENQLLLAWLMKHPAMIHPVVGTTRPERLKESLDATGITLELQDWFTLLEAAQGHKVP
ncbi:aldo/keto reductase [Robiginitalea sp. M366]|uniref:aldo/keto reductase n=1 Tax=Robiginitalea aestuariiviva TaxID=3036903 RepID=UPI00240D3F95|nr:aldo/keto reductase [Robiginitalea aestuariiviva]MDG1571628.1 aldo/keto reductase [Robiginitalea aestuariiviva]